MLASKIQFNRIKQIISAGFKCLYFARLILILRYRFLHLRTLHGFHVSLTRKLKWLITWVWKKLISGLICCEYVHVSITYGKEFPFPFMKSILLFYRQRKLYEDEKHQRVLQLEALRYLWKEVCTFYIFLQLCRANA